MLHQGLGQGNPTGHGRRIARAIGEEDALGLALQHLLHGRVCRENRDITAMGDQTLENRPLDPKVNGHHFVRGGGVLLQALIEARRTERGPAVGLAG